MAAWIAAMDLASWVTLGPAVAALIAAVLWAWSAAVPVPGSVLSANSGPDFARPTFVAIRKSALLSKWAAGFAALSAIHQVAATMVAIAGKGLYPMSSAASAGPQWPSSLTAHRRKT